MSKSHKQLDCMAPPSVSLFCKVTRSVAGFFHVRKRTDSIDLYERKCQALASLKWLGPVAVSQDQDQPSVQKCLQHFADNSTSSICFRLPKAQRSLALKLFESSGDCNKKQMGMETSFTMQQKLLHHCAWWASTDGHCNDQRRLFQL